MAETHIVAQGECLASIAKAYGFRDYHTIYDHPQNAGFKKKRPNPNIIYPGDSLYIPDKEQRTEQRDTGNTHVFQVNKRAVNLRLVLKDAKGTPYSGKPYELTVEGQTFQGSTDGSGKLEQEIPPDASTGELKLYSGATKDAGFLSWNLSIGHLDPPDTVSGAQARLNNLGYYCGTVDGVIGPKTKFALKCFQAQAQIPQTGALDAATIAQLGGSHENAN